MSNGEMPAPAARRLAPSGPQLERPRPAKTGRSPSPWAIVGGALFAGYVLGKAVDWRGHAHPHR